MDRALPLIAALAGFFGGIVLFGMVGRWLYVVTATVREYRNAAQSDALRKSLALALFPVTFLHSGPWAMGIAIVSSYYLLSRPHSPNWLWFFSGASVGLLFMLVLVARAVRRAPTPAESDASNRFFPASSQEVVARRRATLADDTYEGYRLRMWAAFWASIPGTVILSAIWWDAIVRAPELLFFIAILGFLFAYLLGWYFRQFLFPKPWRLPWRK